MFNQGINSSIKEEYGSIYNDEHKKEMQKNVNNQLVFILKDHEDILSAMHSLRAKKQTVTW